MEAVAIVTLLALLQYIWFGMEVGSARGRAGLKAPAMSGDERFERINRVHQNTLELLILLLPSLWIFAYYVNPLWGAGITVVYLIGRFIYRAAYVQDPSSRSLGFTVSIVPALIMLVWSAVKLVSGYF